MLQATIYELLTIAITVFALIRLCKVRKTLKRAEALTYILIVITAIIALCIQMNSILPFIIVTAVLFGAVWLFGNLWSIILKKSPALEALIQIIKKSIQSTKHNH